MAEPKSEWIRRGSIGEIVVAWIQPPGLENPGDFRERNAVSDANAEIFVSARIEFEHELYVPRSGGNPGQIVWLGSVDLGQSTS